MKCLFPLSVLLLTSAVEAQVPRTFLARSEADTTVEGFQSNVIVEIRTQGDSVVWFGTGRGLSVMKDLSLIHI